MKTKKDLKIAKKKQEIMDTCWEIYLQHGYFAVSFNSISEIIICDRTTIYNYYNSVEDIFIDILENAYSIWLERLKCHFDETTQMTKEEFCAHIVDSQNQITKYFKLLANHIKIIDKKGNPENLIKFSNTIQAVNPIFYKSLTKYFPDLSDTQKNDFIYFWSVITDGMIQTKSFQEKTNYLQYFADPSSDSDTFFYKTLLMFMNNL